MTTLEKLHEALGKVQDPELHRPLPDLGMVESVLFADGLATIKILLTISGCPMQDRLKADVTSALTSVDEVKQVALSFGVMS